ncbi:hypothetical protein N9P31_00595 [bacterium]|nr:hypothetical protein [bacterium]
MYAPEFVISITTAVVAERYIASNLEIETIAYKFSTFLQTRYSDENAENIRVAAEAFMHSMLEAGVDNADVILKSYQYDKFLFKGNGKLRKWSSIFGDPLEGIKNRTCNPTAMNRDFKAFVYRTKQSGACNYPTGWSLENQKSSIFFQNMGDLEVSAFDIINIKQSN